MPLDPQLAVLGYFPTGTKDEPDDPPEYIGMSEAELVARKRDGLLLNMVHSMTRPLREGFARPAGRLAGPSGGRNLLDWPFMRSVAL